MTTKVVICSPNDSIDKATELMRDNQIRRVTVVNESGQLLGIVALADVVERADVKPTQTHETLKSVSAPSSEPSKPRAQSRTAAYNPSILRAYRGDLTPGRASSTVGPSAFQRPDRLTTNRGEGHGDLQYLDERPVGPPGASSAAGQQRGGLLRHQRLRRPPGLPERGR
jgi:CBS domain-containing protein